MTTPFSNAELAARVEAHLRRRNADGARLAVGPLSLDPVTNRASLGTTTATLSAREAALLAALIRRAGELLTRAELLRVVWAIDFDPGSDIVDVYVAAVRRKLGPHVIDTVRGRGYRLCPSTLGSIAHRTNPVSEPERTPVRPR